MPTKLDPATRDAALATLPNWTLEPDGAAISRRLAFDGFGAAFAFMTRIALIAETVDHHPEWSNVYNRVDIRLTTHDAGGLSDNDVRMAGAIDAIVD